VVIVLGVVIALAADRWITTVDDAGLAADYLARLEADLVADSGELAQKAEASIEAAAMTRQLLLWIEGEPIPDSVDAESALLGMIVGSWYSPWVPTRTTWAELVATGNLRVLRDSEVREALGQYEELLQMATVWETDWRDASSAMQADLELYIPPLLRLDALRTGFLPARRRVVEMMEGVEVPPPSRRDLERFVREMGSDPQVVANVASAHMTHVARANAYSTAWVTQDALQAALAAVRAAR
jgi:hypothetical protein